MKADMIIKGGSICTLEKDPAWCSAVAVKDGKILALGNENELDGYVGDETEVFDLAGRVMLPGFIDADAAGNQIFSEAGLTDEPGNAYLEYDLEAGGADTESDEADFSSQTQNFNADSSFSNLEQNFSDDSSFSNLKQAFSDDAETESGNQFVGELNADETAVASEVLDAYLSRGYTTVFAAGLPEDTASLYENYLNKRKSDDEFIRQRFLTAVPADLSSLNSDNETDASRRHVSPAAEINEHTVSAAESLGLADSLGSIKEGKIADFVIFDENPFDFKPKKNALLPEAAFVILDGTVVYDSDAESDMEWYTLMSSLQF